LVLRGGTTQVAGRITGQRIPISDCEELSPNDRRYQRSARIADAVLAGQIPDPTAGATHFLNPVVVRQRRDGVLPSWAKSAGLSIGKHTFYSPDAPQRSAVSLIDIVNAIFMRVAGIGEILRNVRVGAHEGRNRRR
jgi:hypothetical protein